MSELSDNYQAEKETEKEVKADALTALKKKADTMGIQYHHKAGVEKIADLIKQREEGVAQDVTPPNIPVAAKGRRLTHRQYQRNQAAKMVRVIISCRNPNKKDWEGEVFTVSNSVAGTFKKYVPYDHEKGWHVPNIIFQHLKERQCQIFYTVKGPRGNKIRKGKLIKELVVEKLPSLTPVERKELAVQQAMAKGQG